MTKTLITAKNPKGVGLAAPQVGISLQLFIIKKDKVSPLHVFINPSFIKTSKKMIKDDKMLEGCLSIKDIWGLVDRYQWVKLAYQDKHGKKNEERFEGMTATIIQHEMDHLNGIIFTRRALEQGQKLYREEKHKDGKPTIEEVKL